MPEATAQVIDKKAGYIQVIWHVMKMATIKLQGASRI